MSQNPIHSFPAAKQEIINFEMSMQFKVNAEDMENIMKFVREMCEYQKLEIVKVIGEHLVNPKAIIHCKNVCDL